MGHSEVAPALCVRATIAGIGVALAIGLGYRASSSPPFAVAGIPAHTLSSYNMHTDYHRLRDEARFADPDHMAAVTEAATHEGVRTPLRPAGPGTEGDTDRVAL